MKDKVFLIQIRFENTLLNIVCHRYFLCAKKIRKSNKISNARVVEGDARGKTRFSHTHVTI